MQGVLPRMALRLGLGSPDSEAPNDDATRKRLMGILPGKPVISPGDWEKIITYYRESAPASLSVQADKPATQDTASLFQAQRSNIPVAALVAGLSYDSLNKRIFAGLKGGILYVFDGNLQAIDSFQTPSTAVQVLGRPDRGIDVLSVGPMVPSDADKGEWAQVSPRVEGRFQVKVQQKGLRRPVYMAQGDLNQDGRSDAVVCQHGHYTGKLSWHEQQADGSYKEHVIEERPGARIAYIADLNHDQLPDILTLWAQGKEEVVFYANKGNGQFAKENWLEFPSVYGSAYLEIADMNGDGFFDLVYTNGDNADYSQILKPYHGIRIFQNDGQNHFTEAHFYPMYGASKALARDFDQDGDLDIAAIAYFPSYLSGKPESFVYLENKGGYVFAPASFPEANTGRWLCMDAADTDGDGDTDLLLGSYSSSVSFAPMDIQGQWSSERRGVLLLKNKLKH
ncbi:MAG: VCBS repeat-containing protein [Bacteroidetes bacterium]|nr:MAG: VCBS repeat-containing protein [Bacteroidota bacterium]